MVKTRRSHETHDEDQEEEEILSLIPNNRSRRPRPKAENFAESDDSGPLDDDYHPRKKKYNMRRQKAVDSESNNDDEVVLNHHHHHNTRRTSPTRRSRMTSENVNDDDDDEDETYGGTRRSSRRRRMVYDTFNLAAIDKYPVAGSQFDEGLARHTRRNKSPSPNRRCPEVEAEENGMDDGLDMYTRVKRPRRQVKKDMYGVPVNDENEGHESNGSTTEVEGEDKNGRVEEEEETESSSDEGPRQYYLREHRPRTQVFDAAPEPSRVITRQPKLMNIIPHSPARRRAQFSERVHKSPAHRTRSFRDRRKRAFHGSSSTSSSSSSSSDEERFERRKSKSMQRSRNRCLPMNLQEDDLTGVLKDRQKIGSSLADVDPMTIDRSVTFESVGGLGSNIRALKEMIIFPLMYPEVFDKFHIQPPRGVLFYGPPGTGKTLVARALANECSKGEKRVSFFMRKGADCLSKWVGESERQLRLLFDQAYQMRPSILFFDEIDGLAPVRSSRQDQIHSSIVSTLLALMDGLDSRGEVVVIGATNRIDSIDPALRRPGRFDREFLFPLPSLPARKQILQIHTSKWHPPLEETFVDQLAEKTVGYCGADLRSLCTEAALFALRRRYPQIYTTSDKLLLDINSIRINVQDFSRAVSAIVPASQRSVTSPGRALSPFILPLLRRQFQNSLHHLRKIFPVASKTKAQDEIQLSDEEDASLSSFSQSSTFRPRIVISGVQGQGQSSHLAPALIHHMEQFPVHVLDLPALYGISARTPEESCAQIFREAKRTSPSIIFMPHLDQWWDAVTDTLTATFMTLLQDVEPTAPILLLATCDRAVRVLPIEVQSLFWHGSRIAMENPNAEERKAFFEDLFTNQVCRVPARKVEMEELEVLPKAIAPEVRKLSDKERKRLFEQEDTTLRELRIFLRDVINKLGQDRKFAIFTKPVDSEEVDDYYEVIKEPMDLSTMMSKIDLHQYQNSSSFLKDIDLICSNALEYNPDKNPADRSIRHRACALRDMARSIMENELDPDFEKRCEEIDEARKNRGASPTKDAPNFYKVPPAQRRTRSSAPVLPQIQSDPETSQKSTPIMKKHGQGRKVTPRSADKVRVMTASAFRALQAKKTRMSPWCRPKRRSNNYKRIVIVDDEEVDEKKQNGETKNETEEDHALTPIEEKTEDDSEAASPKKSPQKSRDNSPDKNRKSTTEDQKSESPVKLRSAKGSPEPKVVLEKMDTSPAKLLEVHQSLEMVNGPTTSPSKSPRTRSPARSPRSLSPRISLNIMDASEMNGVSESSESSVPSTSMPKLTAPTVLVVNNEDSNKENDLPNSVPDLTAEPESKKRKRSDSEIETENETEERTPHASPRVTRWRANHPPPPPLVVDRDAMNHLWSKTVEETRNFDLETLENLHCQLRECIQTHKNEYNKGQLLSDLKRVLEQFFSVRTCSKSS